ncbi:hypothetical protein ACNSPG_06600 [Brucella pituitosa]|uniref:hypothetical protein n=1 Tax=Brucella pituitosa TaxID=571256 RepID=UPI003C764D09
MAKIIQPRYRQIFRENEEKSELAVRIWKEITSALEKVSAVTEVNLARADRYVRARVEYEVLYPDAAEEGPVLKAPEGGAYFNYRWSACEKLNDRLLKLEKAMFGEATAKETGPKEKGRPSPSDEFLGPDNSLRQ